MSNERKIYRSSDRVIAGVCGGIAEFFDLDPTLVRLVYAFFTVTTIFSGVILYIIAWLIVPRKY
ncbi:MULTISPECIES: PspC domain-containing protein [Prevotellaceae]|jgi:phage shock protein C|uniref:PspC family transcriptional regulator n=1 Tax=Prevotella herbatica TaxID=2801997 RepID=A0ABM7NYF2_9BACT|nr:MULTISPECIES: PspC domain-containing protein [Prevotellaceae]BCS85544.1 PspC family transcriptional regulator [Prevotella herbatica]